MPGKSRARGRGRRRQREGSTAARRRSGRPRAFLKIALRAVAGQPTRFLALFAILAIGAGVYAGLRSFVPDMYASADALFDSCALADVRVVSSRGLTAADIEAVRGVEGVADVVGAQTFEASAVPAGPGAAGETFELSVTARDMAACEEGSLGAVNRPFLVEGRLPSGPGEVAVSDTGGIAVGDRIRVTSVRGADGSPGARVADALASPELEVVGLVRSAEWLSASLTVSATSGASLTHYAFVDLSSSAHPSVFTEADLTAEAALAETAFTERYGAAVEPVEDRLKELARERGQGSAWVVVGRAANPSASLFQATALRMDRVCSIFPVFFYLVAGLVCLTVVGRMVRADRVEVGTLKALGFGPRAVAGKYLLFSLLAAVLGAAAGIAVGSYTIPAAVWASYSPLYIDFPFIQALRMPHCAVAFCLATGLALAATLAACLRTLGESACSLMRPSAPKAGRHVLLERRPALWRRLSSASKAAARDVARYRLRALMTVVGVAGCCGLVLTGLGVRDRLDGFVQEQYGSIYTYEVAAHLGEVGSGGGGLPAGLAGALDAVCGEGGWGLFSQQAGLASNPSGDPSKIPFGVGGELDRTGGSVQAELRSGRAGAQEEEGVARDVAVTVPQDPSQSLIDIRDARSGEPLALPDSGAVLTERLAEQLMVDAGDTVLLDLGDGPREVEVKGVMHNYTSHAAYLSAQAYEAAFGEAPAWSLVLGRNPRGLSKAELTRALTEASVLVTGVSVPADEAGPYEDVASGLDSVVGILLASSGALAFIVVYALTEMNVEEREREIATLKVLGRTRREVRSCVFRETWALAALGLVLGLPFGAALADHVMRSAEFDNVIFYRSTSPWCFLAAAVFTLACSAAALLLMRRRVDGVRMGESLKSVD